MHIRRTASLIVQSGIALALVLMVGATPAADPVQVTVESIKLYWLQQLATQEKNIRAGKPANAAERLHKITSTREAIKIGKCDAQAQREADRYNAQLIEAAQPFPSISGQDQLSSEQLRERAAWAEQFGPGETNPAKRERYAKDIREYNEAVAKENIQKARALAIRFERLTGKAVVLEEKDQKKMAAQIAGMEKALAEERAQQALAAQKQRYEDGERWWEIYELERKIRDLESRVK